MKRTLKGILAAAATATCLVAGALPGHAGAFFAWAVTDVPSWDTLNVRAWPSSQSQILVAYPNEVVLSMTGKCTDGVSLDAIAGAPEWQQRQAVRYRWCETWLDPEGDGTYRTGWVYGKYIRPM